MLHLASCQIQSQHDPKIPLTSQRFLRQSLHSHNTKIGKSVIYNSLTVYSEYNKFQQYPVLLPTNITDKLLLISARNIQAFWNEEKPQNILLGNVAEKKANVGKMQLEKHQP